MIQAYSEAEIHFKKEFNNIDKFVINFLKYLKDVKYVIISGYVAVLFGRLRTTEDVDMLIEKLSFEQFRKLASAIRAAGYWFINGNGDGGMYETLEGGSALRVAKSGEFAPNIEFKFASEKPDFYSLNNRVKVVCNGAVFYTSPIDYQIAYKLMMGSGGNKKDIEDAKHLYKLFEKHLDKERLHKFVKEFKAEKFLERIK